jgi:hypothetical protein
MKPNIALLIAVAVLSACSRPVVRETIVERPVPAVAPAPIVTAAAPMPACTYASQSYSQGSVSCQDRNLYRCDNGIWTRTPTPC